MCAEKDMTLYFSLPASRKNFSTICMRVFFFYCYVLMVITKMYYNIEKRSKNLSPPFPSCTVVLSILRLSAASACEPRRQPAQACKSFIFRMYISGTFNKMRGYGFINCFFFLGKPILIGFHRLADAQDVMGLVVQV